MCCTSFLESLCWQDVVWLTVHWDPNKFSSGSMNVFRYFKSHSIQLLQRQFCGAQILPVFFASLKAFQMSQYFDWYNLVLQVLIVNYITSVKNKVLSSCSSRRKRPKYFNLIHTLKSDRIHIIFVSVSHWLYYLYIPCFHKNNNF